MIELLNIAECNNKLNIVQFDGVNYIFSYDSLIGLIYKDCFILDDYYKGYSATTNRHIAYIKNDFNYYGQFIPVKSKTFRELKQTKFNLDVIDCIIKRDIENKQINHILWNFKEAITVNNFNEQLKELKENLKEITENELKVIDQNVEKLKTVTQLRVTYKINEITFKLIFSYSNDKKKALKNIRFLNYDIENI